MASLDGVCANCGMPLSRFWQGSCQHCGAPAEVARGALAQAAPIPQPPPPFAPSPAPPLAPPPPPLGWAPPTPPTRVQSVLRGPTEAACLQAAFGDAQQAATNGYVPVSQVWGRDADGLTLTVIYDRVGAAAMTAGAPPPPPYAPPPPAYAPPPPAAAAPSMPGHPSGAQPPGNVAAALGGKLLRFVLVFVVAFVVWYVYYSLERNL